MAGIAGYALCVIRSCDLREILRFGCVRFVAAGADHCRVELRGFYRGRIVGVPGLRAMTRFTWDNHMLTEIFMLDHIGVACFANVVPCMCNRPGRDLGNGIAAIMPILTERLGNDGRTQQDKCDDRDAHHDCEPDEVFEVFKQKVPSRRPIATPTNTRGEPR